MALLKINEHVAMLSRHHTTFPVPKSHVFCKAIHNTSKLAVAQVKLNPLFRQSYPSADRGQAAITSCWEMQWFSFTTEAANSAELAFNWKGSLHHSCLQESDEKTS